MWNKQITSITPNVVLYPSIVFECGWSESFPRLRKDKDLWIRGCGGHVELVILIKFNKLAGGRVSGIVEVWARDAAANDRLIQTEVIANLPAYSRKRQLTAIAYLSYPVRPICCCPVNTSHPIAIFWGSGTSWAQPRGRPRVPFGRASNYCTTIAIHHGLAACSVNGFPSSGIINSYIEENELFEVVFGTLDTW